MVAATWDQIIEQHLQERMEKGEKKYGVFNAGNESRSFVKETFDELYDAINYVRMGVLSGQFEEDFGQVLEDGIRIALYLLFINVVKQR